MKKGLIYHRPIVIHLFDSLTLRAPRMLCCAKLNSNRIANHIFS